VVRAEQHRNHGGGKSGACAPGGSGRARIRRRRGRRSAGAKTRAPDTHAAVEQRHKKELEQVHIVLGVPSYPLAHERRYAASLLNIILGGGMSSRLFQNIRERQGLAYAIGSDLSPYTDSGVLSVYAGTSRESAAQADPFGVEEFRRIRQDR
jgi:predicted Zn-dependent peptidase